MLNDEKYKEKTKEMKKGVKKHVLTAQEMFEELGYKKDEYFFPDTPAYKDEYQSLMITKGGITIISKNERVVPISLTSLSTEEIKAIYKQIEELEQC